MSTLRKIERFPVTCSAGIPPLQFRTISPTLSAMPSVRTMGGTAVELHVKIVWALETPKAVLSKKKEKQE
jgi:hypothetical protein